MARHRSAYDKPQDDTFSEVNCSLEGQLANIADRIAYNCHDLEDGMRAGLISSEQLKNLEIITEAQKSINAEAIKDRTIRRTRTAKTIIDRLVSDCIDASKKALAQDGVKTVDDVYAIEDNLIVLSVESDNQLVELEKFLMQNFYMHKSLLETANQVRAWLGQLFERLCHNPGLMPGYFQRFIPQHGLQRTVADYIAGMTDRFACKMLEEV